MTVAQFHTVARLLAQTDVRGSQRVNFTQFTNDKCTLRFMDNDKRFYAYKINTDGTFEELEV